MVLREPHQSILLALSQSQSLWKPASQDLVLGLQVANLSGQFTVRGLGYDEHQRGVNVSKARHRDYAVIYGVSRYRSGLFAPRVWASKVVSEAPISIQGCHPPKQSESRHTRPLEDRM